MKNNPNQPKPGPLSLVRAIVGRLQRKQPRSVALQMAGEQTARAHTIAGRARLSAIGLETHAEKGNRILQEALATDDNTPGVVDAEEARELASHMIDGSVAIHDHRKTVEELI